MNYPAGTIFKMHDKKKNKCVLVMLKIDNSIPSHENKNYLCLHKEEGGQIGYMGWIKEEECRFDDYAFEFIEPK